MLASATKFKDQLASKLSDLVPPLESQCLHFREAEMAVFMEDYLALLRWCHFSTATDGLGRLPAAAVATEPVMNAAMKGLTCGAQACTGPNGGPTRSGSPARDAPATMVEHIDLDSCRGDT